MAERQEPQAQPTAAKEAAPPREKQGSGHDPSLHKYGSATEVREEPRKREG